MGYGFMCWTKKMCHKFMCKQWKGSAMDCFHWLKHEGDKEEEAEIKTKGGQQPCTQAKHWQQLFFEIIGINIFL